jgi:nucleotide-binding universal stress UspA family protein
MSESPESPTVTQRATGKVRKWGRVLVGTDGSEGAARAVDAAGALAADLGADVWIAVVMDGSSQSILQQIARDDNVSIGDVAETVARRFLNEAARRAEDNGARNIQTLLRSGDCAAELIAAAQEIDATAIFVGRRGAGGRLHEALIGSVSQKLAGISPRMLVIVP